MKIANCVPSNFDSSLKKSIFKTAEQIDIKDHEFQWTHLRVSLFKIFWRIRIEWLVRQRPAHLGSWKFIMLILFLDCYRAKFIFIIDKVVEMWNSKYFDFFVAHFNKGALFCVTNPRSFFSTRTWRASTDLTPGKKIFSKFLQVFLVVFKWPLMTKYEKKRGVVKNNYRKNYLCWGNQKNFDFDFCVATASWGTHSVNFRTKHLCRI